MCPYCVVVLGVNCLDNFRQAVIQKRNYEHMQKQERTKYVVVNYAFSCKLFV